MASESEDHTINIVYSSSDEECLSAAKNKAGICFENEEETTHDGDNNDHTNESDVLVSVKVEELDEESPPSESNNQICNESDPPQVKKNKKRKKSKKPPLFRCIQCNTGFRSIADLKTHSLEHQVKTRYKCEDCGRYFKKAFTLGIHRRIHNKFVECPICKQKYPTPKEVRCHMTLSHEATVACALCKEKFHTRWQRDNHSERVHSTRKQKIKNKNSTPETTKSKGNAKHAESHMETEDCRPKQPTPSGSRECAGPLSWADLNHPTKCAILSKMYKGRSVPDVCRLFDLPPRVVNEVWEYRKKYFLPEGTGRVPSTSMTNILDGLLVEWFHKQKAKGVHVSGKMLQETAETFARDCNFVSFNGSNKWLHNFKLRYNITFREKPTKKDRHRQLESNWQKEFFREKWGDARIGVPDEDIYTGDEFGFFYNTSKGRIKKPAGYKYIQGCVQDRLSVFFCANTSGKDKRRLVVCGTEDPLRYSHRDPETLPVTYVRHPQAHFTTQMFEEYVECWNKELVKKNKKVLLVLDRATIHSKLLLSNLKLLFVPWNASNTIMPMKNGVSSRFRSEFRRLILEEKAMNVLRGIDRNLTCLEALNMMEKAWARTPPEVITKSFLDTGYNITVAPRDKVADRPRVSDCDEQVLCNILKDYDVETYYTTLSDMDHYMKVDEELVTGQGTNLSAFGGNRKANDTINCAAKDKDERLPIATDKPETVEKEVLVKKSGVLQDLEIIRKYLHSNDTTYETFCSFMEIENFAMQRIMS